MKITQSKIWHWLSLIALAVIIMLPLYLSHVPAAFLLGSIVTGIIFSLTNTGLSVPKPVFNLAQGVLGCLTAKAMTGSVLADLMSYWQLALIITISTIIISLLLGLFMVRCSSLSQSTAIWGIMPGGASIMVAICGDYGADRRLVALIQYCRVLGVVAMLAIFSHFFVREFPANLVLEPVWLPAPTLNLLYTLLIAMVGVLVTRLIKLPSGRVFIPMIIGATLQINGLLQLETPPWLLLLCFGSIGLSVGLGFNLAIIKLAIRTLPIILLTIIIMLAFCYAQAVLLHVGLGIDYLTCFLATSPGGLETSVIIALDTHSDLAVILPLQILRLFSVLLFGPMIARYLTKK